MKSMSIATAVLWLVSCFQVFAQERGKFALPGIDTIPLSAVQLSNDEVAGLFVVSDVYSRVSAVSESGARAHAESVRHAACDSYIINCDDHNNPLTRPFTFLGRYPLLPTTQDAIQWLLEEVSRVGAQVVTRSSGTTSTGIVGTYGATLPFVLLDSAGNGGTDSFFVDSMGVHYDRETDTFRSTYGHGPFDRDHPAVVGPAKIRDAVEAQKVIYVSDFFLEQGVPLRYGSSTGCLGIEESCVFQPGRGGGTSIQSPILGSTMASLLAVFPEYDAFDLAALVNSCAKHFPSISGGIVDVPCMIETICEETGDWSSACSVEQPGPVVSKTHIGTLENPTADPNKLYNERSGISAISGWTCDAEIIEIELNGVRWRAGNHTTRSDTEEVCGDSDNGFSLLYNWNLLGDGIHTVRAFADGVLFAETRVRVTTFGEEFLRDAYGNSAIGFSPHGRDGREDIINLQWEQSLQNFVFIGEADPLPKTGFTTVAAVRGYLENPSLGSFQSGISAISGWTCDAEIIEIELNGVRWRAGNHTTRSDTEEVCGDSDNGFSLLYNWNLLGDGIHTVRAFADGVLFAETQVRVTTFGEEFLWDAYGSSGGPVCVPGRDCHNVKIEWWKTLQNFVIVAER